MLIKSQRAFFFVKSELEIDFAHIDRTAAVAICATAAVGSIFLSFMQDCNPHLSESVAEDMGCPFEEQFQVITGLLGTVTVGSVLFTLSFQPRLLSQKDQQLALDAIRELDLQKLKRILKDKTLTEDFFISMITEVAQKGQIDTLQFLLEQTVPLKDKYLEDAFVAAFENHGELVLDYLWDNFLLPRLKNKKSELSYYLLEKVLYDGAARGLVSVIKQVFSNHEFNSYVVDEVYTKALEHQQEEVLTFLLSNNITPGEYLPLINYKILKWLVVEQKLELLKLSLKKMDISETLFKEVVLEAISLKKLESAAVMIAESLEDIHHTKTILRQAIANGALIVIQAIITRYGILFEDIRLAHRECCQKGYLDCFKYLLDMEETCDERALKNDIQVAARAEQYEIIEFLIQRFTSQIMTIRQDLILWGIWQNYGELVCNLIKMGPLPLLSIEIFRHWVSEAGSSAEMLSYLEEADVSESFDVLPQQEGVLDDLEEEVIYPPDVSSYIQGPQESTMYVNLEDVKNEPLAHLIHFIMLKPRSITLIDQPDTIDVGGVSKEFIQTLAVALAPLIPKGVGRDPKNLCIFTRLGEFFSILEEKNRYRSDPFLTGPLFPISFFADLKDFLMSDQEQSAFKKMIERRAKENPHLYEILANYVLNPSKNNLKAFAESMGLKLKEAKCEAREIFYQYLEPAKAFLQGASDELKKLITQTDPQLLESMLQGKAISSSQLIGLLQVEEQNPELLLQVSWICEAIEQNVLCARSFFRAITGCEHFTKGLRINVRTAECSAIKIRTCANTLEIPAQLNDKELFLASLCACLDTGFNAI